MELKSLIEAASKGRPRMHLATEIGIPYQNLHNYEKGAKPCPAWVVARLAEIAGTDPKTAALQALKDSAKSPAESELWGRLLRSLVGGALALAVAIPGFTALKTPYSLEVGANRPLYTLCKHLK